MHRWIGCIASLLLGLSAVTELRAQSSADEAAAKVDPPDAEYRAGTQDPDPSVERRLPVVAPYRGYLPAVIELARMPPVGDQAAAPSSAAWAAAYAARGYYVGALEGRDISEPANLPSPSYVYHLARQGGCDDGTNIPRVVEVLRRGAPSLAEQPFTADCVPPASPSVVASEHDFRVQGLRRIDLKRIDDVKGELAGSNPVIVELRVGAAFRRLRGGATFAETDADAAAGKDTASQFVTLTGYDEHRQAFRLVNSWGAGWGDRGYAWLGYDAFRTHVARAYVLDLAAPRRAKAGGRTAGKGADDLAALEDLACGKIRARTDGDRQALSGFVASDADLDVVNAVAARAQATLVADVAVTPWPLCEALQTLDHPLAAADPPKITVGGGGTLRAGDTMTIEVRSAGPPRHIYVSYVQADGSIMHLAQPGATGDPTSAALTFGDGREGRSRFLVGPPFGREMIVAIASPQRLFDAALPARQAARDYLTALRRALIYRRSPDQPDVEASAAIKILRTQAR